MSQRRNPVRKGVKTMLVIFAILGILGVLLLAVSILLGLIVLAAAEGFFVVAYRRFSRAARSDA